jgi:hypothetical protein
MSMSNLSCRLQHLRSYILFPFPSAGLRHVLLCQHREEIASQGDLNSRSKSRCMRKKAFFSFSVAFETSEASAYRRRCSVLMYSADLILLIRYALTAVIIFPLQFKMLRMKNAVSLTIFSHMPGKLQFVIENQHMLLFLCIYI